ncbi:hypothetical protein ACFR97_10370 [Haloplanus litoreus]|uniref:Uncharacterized protein n=1 Tax=Haloplanus litoreus TaxID=767515 RepID=A0ABD5ZT92_9EURY
MSSDRPGGLTIRFRPNSGRGTPERLRLESRTDGLHDYYEDYWNGCKWLPRGHDVLADVEVEGTLDGTAVLTRPDGGETTADRLREHLEDAVEATTADPAETRRHLREALQLLDAIEEGV